MSLLTVGLPQKASYGSAQDRTILHDVCCTVLLTNRAQSGSLGKANLIVTKFTGNRCTSTVELKFCISCGNKKTTNTLVKDAYSEAAMSCNKIDVRFASRKVCSGKIEVVRVRFVVQKINLRNQTVKFTTRKTTNLFELHIMILRSL